MATLERLTEVKDGIRRLPAVLRLVWRASPAGAVVLALCTLVASAMPLGVAWIGKRLVDAVVARDADAALRFVVIELGLVSAQSLVQRVQQWVQGRLGGRLVIDIHVAILEKALALDLKHFENHDFYDKLVRARNEASYRPVSFVTGSLHLVQSTLTLLGYIGLLVRFSPWAVLGLLVAAVPATLVEMYFSRVAFKLRNWRSPDRRRLNYVEYVLANDGHVKEVKLLDLGPRLLQRYRSLSGTFFDEEQRISWRRAVWGWTLSLLGSLGFYGCYALLALRAAAGVLSLGNLTLYIAAFRDGQRSFQSILNSLGEMYEHSLYLGNLFSFLAIPTGPSALADRAPATSAPSVHAPSGQPLLPDPGERGIRLDDVGFRYPSAASEEGGGAWVFRHVNLLIPAGQALALVGANGAGKTTLVKLMTGLYEPSEGRVLLDGRDLRDWDRGALRRRFSAVFQDFNKYQFSVRENVGIASADHETDEPRIVRAVDKGGATEVIAELPRGLDTQLGTWFKGGSELSGGQWQKLALARAFMREESDILILDEPTAALDAETEHAVFERFRALAESRTTILISHRFPTVRMADRILVLEGGSIIEEGSHAELLARGARYAQLFELQARGYQ